MPWPIPNVKTIFSRMAVTIEQALSVLNPNIDPLAISRASRSSKGMISILQRPVALEAREIHDHIAYYARQYFVDTAEAEFVLRHAQIWGIAPRAATIARGTVLIEGVVNTALPAKLQFSNADGLIFITTQSATISENGRVEVPLNSVATGIENNLSAGEVVNTVEPFLNINKATIFTALSGGAEAEDWQSLRARVLARIRQAPHGGAGFDYIAWLKAKFDIHAVSVVTDWIGRGSVGIIVAINNGADGREPTKAEQDAMLDYLGRPNSTTGVRPVTAHVVVVAAKAKAIPLTIRVRPFTFATKQAIEEAYSAFLRSLGDENDPYNASPIGATIELSRLSEALSAASGEYAHDLITPTKSITLERTEYAIAGTITFEASP